MFSFSPLVVLAHLAQHAVAIPRAVSQSLVAVVPQVESAGIGAEFEAYEFELRNEHCSGTDTFASKGERIEGHDPQNPNFKLTVDTSSAKGQLFTEYVLDGTRIKVGSGDAAKTGKAVSEDILSWTPWNSKAPKLNVVHGRCNPWQIFMPASGADPKAMWWGPQVTAAMPLEAIYALMKEQEDDPDETHRNILNGGTQPLSVIEKGYFQSSGIDASKLTDDVLGFCSLVMTYAKFAKTNRYPQGSIKFATSLMPRTEFNTLFKQVKAKLPPNVDLAKLFVSLACYHKDKIGRVILDPDYCTGTPSSPKSTGQFEKLSYKSITHPDANFAIVDWIARIGKGDPSPDDLTVFDKLEDGSIGAYGAKVENMYKTERAVPLFEFRDLDPILSGDIESFMAKADLAVQKLHEKFAQPPRLSSDMEL